MPSQLRTILDRLPGRPRRPGILRQIRLKRLGERIDLAGRLWRCVYLCQVRQRVNLRPALREEEIDVFFAVDLPARIQAVELPARNQPGHALLQLR